MILIGQIFYQFASSLVGYSEPDLFDKPDVELDAKLKEQITQTRFHCVVKKAISRVDYRKPSLALY